MSEIDWASLHKDATTTLEGEFPVQVTEAVATKSSTDKPMIKVKMRVESGTFAGRTLFGQFTISAENSNAMRIFFGQMAMFGLDSAFFAANPHAPLEVIAQSLVNRRAVAVVEGREWNGTLRENIKEFKRALAGPGGGLATSLGGPSSGLPAGGPVSTSAPTTPAQSTAPSTPAPDDPFA